MKWFKHFTDSLSDPFIEELMDNYSHAGYVAWFGLIEIICKENKYNITGDLEISPIYLKRKLRISTAKLKQIFGFCQTKGKLLFNISQEKWIFKFSKVADLKDNYTKNLQVTSKKVSLEVEEDKKKKEKKKKPLAGFEEFYKAYPKKKSKGQAEKTWNKLSPTNDLLKTMLAGLGAAKKSEDWTKDGGKWIPHPSTWLNNKGWEDEISNNPSTPKRPELKKLN
ncbi:DUF4373 domain-containing protein [Candidatus Pacearchaeota archaeon]|nr:DUF4373 domain-containing protein [Candidatus Pacearchaeota archaeon]